ncbi:hypothetical protein ACFWZ2_07445 [Streptomyces sp. NPDC059002]|uniref:hypothetical protein n=1 Tax=Streptomyces sp. NPDC059002 TaxID=3346690 RepID=UPI0036824362
MAALNREFNGKEAARNGPERTGVNQYGPAEAVIEAGIGTGLRKEAKTHHCRRQ